MHMGLFLSIFWLIQQFQLKIETAHRQQSFNNYQITRRTLQLFSTYSTILCILLEVILLPFIGFYCLGTLGFIFSILVLRACSKNKIQFIGMSIVCLIPFFLSVIINNESVIIQKLCIYGMQWVVASFLVIFSSFHNNDVFHIKDIILCIIVALTPFLLISLTIQNVLLVIGQSSVPFQCCKLKQT